MESIPKRPAGITVCALIIIGMGLLGVLASMSSVGMFQGGGDGAITIKLLVNPLISAVALCVGLGLHAFRRWAFISALAYFGVVTTFGVLSGLGGLTAGWLGVLIAAPVALYLWGRREAFGGSDSSLEGAISLTAFDDEAKVASSKPVPTRRDGLRFLSVLFYIGAIATFAFPFLSFASWSGKVTILTGLQLTTGTSIDQPEVLIPLVAGPSLLIVASAILAFLGIGLSVAGEKFSASAGISGLLATASTLLLRYRLFAEVFTASNGSYKLITEPAYVAAIFLLLAGGLWNMRRFFATVEQPSYSADVVEAS
jgi:hypothetical protein